MAEFGAIRAGTLAAAVFGVLTAVAPPTAAQEPAVEDPAGLRPLMEAMYTPEMQRHALGLAGDSAMPSLSVPGMPDEALAAIMRILREEAEPYLPELYVAEIDALVQVHYKYLGEAGVAELIRLYETPIGKRLLEVQETMMTEYFDQTLPRQEAILAEATETAITRAMSEIYGIPAPK